jgi:hypothetical protein
MEGAFRIGSVDQILDEHTLSSMYGIAVEVDELHGHRIVVARRQPSGEYPRQTDR